MGEVYQARDTRLDRDVALKVPPAAFADDPDRLARFESLRENVMGNQRTTLTRRRFALTGLMGAAGLAMSAGARGQDLETFKALGLDKRADLSRLNNGRSREDFARFLRPAEDNQYHPCAEAHPAADTPRGEVRQIENWAQSRVFPQTERNIWVYRPAQLASSSERPDLMVFQDGGGYVDPEGAVRVPAVLDTLIHAGDLRPTVAVFVNPGARAVPRDASDPDLGQQRSVEYDTLRERPSVARPPLYACHAGISIKGSAR